MAGKIKDLVGHRFGMLTVIAEAGRTKYGMSKWHCCCDCGNERIKERAALISGRAKSCGCWTRSQFKRTHGMTDTRIYRIWHAMRQRCYNQNSDNYIHYGERGIIICDEWRNNFQAFHDWAMVNGYSDVLTIDRKDNDGNYEPNNCRWTTQKEQNNNMRRREITFLHEGEQKSLKQIAKEYKIPYTTFQQRIKRGWTLQEAIKGKMEGK